MSQQAPSFLKQTYAQRATAHPSTAAASLLTLMESKRTNLAVAADVTTKAELLRIADAVGPYICIFKTHIDIVTDFDTDLVTQLQALAEKHKFQLFEDRKFADIGNTVKLQYGAGVYKIASWAHIVNAHPLPGDGIVRGLKDVGGPLSRGLLLIAELSTAGSMATGAYTTEAVRMAGRHRDFVFGFIGQRRIDRLEDTGEAVNDDFLVLTPGVGLDVTGDGLGQQYRTPQQAVVGSGSDVIIVGRGIYGSGDLVENAVRYRDAGWKAYLERTGQQ